MHYFEDLKGPTMYYHCILPEVANQEGLFELSKAAILKNEVVMWLDENIGADNWQFFQGIQIIGFMFKEDAMAFMLRWS